MAALYGSFHHIIEEVAIERQPDPVIVYQDEVPTDFSAFDLTLYEADAAFEVEHFDSMSEVIRRFYSEKDRSSRIRQRSTDLRKVLTTLMERAGKKLMIQEKQLRDTEGMDKYRVYGELLHTYGYSLQGGEDQLVCENYYTNSEITIPLQKDLSAAENAKRYLEKYQKQKRTKENVTVQLEETRKEVEHLESIRTALDIAESEEDLQDIRREMIDFGFLHKTPGKGKNRLQRKSKPYHWVTSDGYELFIGKNNYQNEDVSFRLGDSGDLWFHAKGVTGSHVIVKTGGQPMEEVPDRVFIEAAELAAYFSSHREDPKVEVDYTIRKNLRKVPNQAPGFVIYHTNWSVTVEPKNLLNA